MYFQTKQGEVQDFYYEESYFVLSFTKMSLIHRTSFIRMR